MTFLRVVEFLWVGDICAVRAVKYGYHDRLVCPMLGRAQALVDRHKMTLVPGLPRWAGLLVVAQRVRRWFNVVRATEIGSMVHISDGLGPTPWAGVVGVVCSHARRNATTKVHVNGLGPVVLRTARSYTRLPVTWLSNSRIQGVLVVSGKEMALVSDAQDRQRRKRLRDRL